MKRKSEQGCAFGSVGELDPTVIEALDAYRQYTNEVLSEALEEGSLVEIEPWEQYLSEYLLAELQAARGEG